MVLPYLSYCAEVWGSNYKTTTQSLFILQKRAIRIIKNVGYRDHTNPLFLELKLLKLSDLVEFQIAQIMFKAKNVQLPGNIQILFNERQGHHYLRGSVIFTNVRVRTTKRSFCVSVCGVKIWNNLSEELKGCPNIKLFKKRYKDTILTRYRDETAKP